MDRIIKAVIFDGQARASVLDTTEAVNRLIAIHHLSPLSAAALGRTITAGAYISANLKGKGDRFNMIVDGGGPLGKIVVAGESGGTVKGFVEHPAIELPPKNGKLDVGGAVGKEGFLTLIKDLGLKEPYVGRSPLVTGEIAEDFASYLLHSEGIASAVALGVLTDCNGCKAAGGVIVEALPSADENTLVMLEDIVRNFTSVSALLSEKSAEEIMDFYFGHLHCEVLDTEPIRLFCNCAEKVEGIIAGLGRQEAESIIKEQGKIEINCDYCRSQYVYTEKDLDRIFADD